MNYLAGDHNNIVLSEVSAPNYDRILTFVFKREIGTVYEYKKEIGNNHVGVERVGATYTRDESHKRRIRERDRIKIREFLNVRLILTFENESNEFIIKKNLKKIHNDEELDKKLNKIKDSLYQDLSSIPKEKLLNDSEKDNISNLASRFTGTNYIFSEISETDWEDYNKNVDSYIEDLKIFLKKRKEHFEKLNNTLKFNIELHNIGKEMATDIDLYLSIPKPCEFIEKIPRFQLEPPKIPKKPRPSLQKIYNPLANMRESMAGVTRALTSNLGSVFETLEFPLSESIRTLGSLSNYSIENEQNSNVHAEKLKQGYFLQFNDIRVKIPSITKYSELPIQFIISTGTPSRTFKDILVLKIDTH